MPSAAQLNVAQEERRPESVGDTLRTLVRAYQPVRQLGDHPTASRPSPVAGSSSLAPWRGAPFVIR